jgi:hypothetical protein
MSTTSAILAIRRWFHYIDVLVSCPTTASRWRPHLLPLWSTATNLIFFSLHVWTRSAHRGKFRDDRSDLSNTSVSSFAVATDPLSRMSRIVDTS